MKIELDVQTAEASAFIRAAWSDQLPFATMRAINRTATDFQEAQRAHQRTIFEIRRPQFVDRAVKVKPFATKQSLEAVVSIDPPGGQARANILTKFEDQTSKLPFRGSRIAIPTENVPRLGSGIIPKAWRPANLGLATTHGRVFSRSGNVLKGKRGTFAILRPGGRGVILERDGGDVRVLYTLVPRVRIRPNLRFMANAERTVQARWNENFSDAFDHAMRTAKGPNVGGAARSFAAALGAM